ncbi:MAG: Trp family transcriptional regulator [Patescibacteria group bacterium]
MVNVSKKKLKKSVSEKINSRLVNIVANLETNTSTEDFLNDLLTESERIVLAKRLSVIFMLYEKISMYRIHVILNVSKSTVTKMANDIDFGKYENILKIVEKKKNRITFWDGMEIVLKCGMPPIVGKGRWDFLNQIDEKYNFKK